MRHEEDSLQMQCVAWFGWQFPSLKRLLHHSPNGGRRDAREGARFKQMGVQAGFPDLLLLVASESKHGLLIELKSRTGKQSEFQKEYQSLVEAQGYRYEVVRSLQQFMSVVRDYLMVVQE